MAVRGRGETCELTQLMERTPETGGELMERPVLGSALFQRAGGWHREHL